VQISAILRRRAAGSCGSWCLQLPGAGQLADRG